MKSLNPLDRIDVYCSDTSHKWYDDPPCVYKTIDNTKLYLCQNKNGNEIISYKYSLIDTISGKPEHFPEVTSSNSIFHRIDESYKKINLSVLENIPSLAS